MKYFISILVLFLSTFCYANVKDSTGVEVVQNKICIKYIVEVKETLYSISKKYNVSETILKKFNPSLEKGLKVGQLLYIPLPETQQKPKNTSNSQGNQYHEVEKGDTYYSIAKKYGIEVDSLLKWNQKSTLQMGKKMLISPLQNKAEIVYQPAKTTTETKETPKEMVSYITVPKNTEVNTTVQKKASYDAKGNFIYDKSTQQVLIIPFYPNLYFSDADVEISKHSHITQIQVRENFRKELMLAIEPKGFQSIYLLGGGIKDSVADLAKIYEAVKYKHQEVLENVDAPNKTDTKNTSRFAKKIDEKTGFTEKYLATQIIDSTIFSFFEKKYNADYFIFINQFEIVTQQAKKGETTSSKMLIAHFTIFQKDGKKIAGNKCKIPYTEDTNNIHRIIRDNFPAIGKQIANEMPAPTY